MNLYLIGYRGCGKTIVARVLAAELGWDWADSDDEIERQTGKSIAQIFHDDGESSFRRQETEVLRKLAAGDQQVIALGGGAVLSATNRQLIATNSKVVWLTAATATLAARISGDPSSSSRRPALSSLDPIAEIESVLAERTPLYEQCADLKIDTEGQSVPQVTGRIRQQFPLDR